MEGILNIIDQLELSANTIKNYKSQFRRIHKDLNTNGSIDYMTDTDVLITYFNTFESVSSKRLKASVVSKILQNTNTDHFQHEIEELSDYMKSLNSEERPKPLVVDLTLAEIKTKIKAIKGDKTAMLLLMLVTNHPVLRGDYNSIKLNNFDEEEDNYYDGKRLVFNHLLKVDNDIRPIKVNAQEKDILDSIKATGDEYLFGYANEDGFNRYLRKISKKYIGFPYGIQHYRRLYVSTELNGKVAMDNKARDLAQQMNHSTRVQSSNYLWQI